MDIMNFFDNEDKAAQEAAFHSCNELLRREGLSLDESAIVEVRLSARTNTATITISSNGDEVKKHIVELPENWLAEIIRRDTEGLPE